MPKFPKSFLHSIITAATLAPSSHNSQPWKFVPNENSLSLFVHPQRRLAISDINDRQLHISLGCAITNAVVAAEYRNYAVEVRYFPDPANQMLVATMYFTASTTSVKKKEHLALSVPVRVTNRNPYENRLPPESFLNGIKTLATEDLRIDFIRTQEQKNEIANIVLASIGEAMADRNFREELSKYMKSNITKSSIGMPGFGFGFPLLVSLIVPTILRYVDMSKISRKQDESLLKKSTPLFIAISTRSDDKVSWIRAGQVYEQIALRATRIKLSTAILAAPIQISDYYKGLQNVIKTEFRPQVFFRVGYTDKTVPHSPRITVT